MIPILQRLLATLVAGAYVISPIDLVPDFLLGFGQMDDLTVLISVIIYWIQFLRTGK
jgi:uncharacterized membrane protein YkvA (DUF1232 family)